MSYGPLILAGGGTCHCLGNFPKGGNKCALAMTEKTAANSDTMDGRTLPLGCLPDPTWFNLTSLMDMLDGCIDVADSSRAMERR